MPETLKLGGDAAFDWGLVAQSNIMTPGSTTTGDRNNY